MSTNIFEQASRLGILFDSSFGTFYLNELWRLPLIGQNGKASLDELARQYYARIKLAEKSSAGKVSSPADGKVSSPADALTQLRLDIILHIIKVKTEDLLESIRQKETAMTRQKIMEFIEQKQDEELKAASIAELRTPLDAL